MSSTQLAVLPPQELVRQSTDIAGLCKEIVLKSAMEIQKRKYVKVEGWQSIATAHGCVASSRDVERVDGGYRAIGEVRRMSDGALIAQAEGFVGEDEPTWFGGEAEVWDKDERRRVMKTLPKRPDYAIRAMAQTRAISRACRSAFAHVVVLMDAGLSTTPAEEVPHGGFEDRHNDEAVERRQQSREDAARSVGTEQPHSPQRELKQNATTGDLVIHFGKHKGKKLSELEPRSLSWFQSKWEPQPYNGRISEKDQALKDAAMAMKGTPADGTEPPPPVEDDEIPLFNGPNHKRLAADLAFHNILPDHFMAAMRDAGHIPPEAKMFASMTETTAEKFVADVEGILSIVEAYREKQKAARAPMRLQDNEHSRSR